MAALIHEIG